ncbi:helicase associated domain-containing protein, partial [Streptomyces sp. NPDC056309]|uniref:helicase associated domain-containing protein n=1 Tax=unclassified Streptomyces TaxID=2593676 RepID=UPI0035D664C7
MPAHQAAALSALYPWWHAPWSTLWQRTWHQARDHTEAHGPLQPASGFPTTSYSLGEWLYLQCTRYPTLHPEQQRLLTQIGTNAAAAAAARPRRRNMKAGAQEALTHTRSYTAAHGHLAQVSATTVHHGYPLGRWHAGQRSQQQRRVLSPERQQALNAIDPWWCPPWNLKWQRSYHRARDAADGHVLRPENGFSNLHDALAARWLQRQCATYNELSPEQQQLLAGIGTTNGVARTAREHARATLKTPSATPVRDAEDKTDQAGRAAGPASPTGQHRTRRTDEAQSPREPRSRLGHRPDQGKHPPSTPRTPRAQRLRQQLTTTRPRPSDKTEQQAVTGNPFNLAPEQWQHLAAARQAYTDTVSTYYDETLQHVAQQARVSGDIGKADIGALLMWKRLRADTPWSARLMALADADVRRTTATATTAARDPSLSRSAAAQAARAALTPLPGFRTGDAL